MRSNELQPYGGELLKLIRTLLERGEWDEYEDPQTFIHAAVLPQTENSFDLLARESHRSVAVITENGYPVSFICKRSPVYVALIPCETIMEIVLISKIRNGCYKARRLSFSPAL